MGRKHLALGLVVLLFILTLAPGAAGAVQRTYEVTSEAQFLEAINEINALDEGIYEVVIKSDITVKKEVALEKSTVSLLGENTAQKQAVLQLLRAFDNSCKRPS